MSNERRVILFDHPGKVFPSIAAAAAWCSGERSSLSRALHRRSTYKGYSFVFEGTTRKPRKIIPGNTTNHPGKKISEFDADGNLLKIYPSKCEAARRMGIDKKSLNMILDGRLRNHSGKIFEVTTPLDECLIEIRERNKLAYTTK